MARSPSRAPRTRARHCSERRRAGGLFRASKLAYDEIGDIAAPRLALGWLSANPELSAQDLGRLYTKAELAPALRVDLRREAEGSRVLRAHGGEDLERADGRWEDFDARAGR